MTEQDQEYLNATLFGTSMLQALRSLLQGLDIVPDALVEFLPLLEENAEGARE